MVTRKKKILKVVALAAILIVVSARLYAWKSASDFGRYYAETFRWMAKSEFSNTKDLKDFFNDVPLATYHQRARSLGFLGGGYSARIDEFKSAMTYLSTEASLPAEQRTTVPPDLKYFTLKITDRSDDALVEASIALIEDYKRQLSFP